MQTVRRSFIFGPLNNSVEHGVVKNDAVGAFHVGMRVWERLYGGANGTVISYKFHNGENLGAAKVQRQILDAMHAGAEGQLYDAICYFGHGWKDGLASAGWGNNSIGSFIEAVDQLGSVDCKVMLYACSCAMPGGIAYKISEGLRVWWQTGTEVHGHVSVGHTFANPQYRRYPNNGSDVGYTVAPAGKVQKWMDAIRDQKNTLWARYPFMTADELAASL